MIKRCIGYWLKIVNMQEHRYVKKCYLMLKCYDEAGDSNWASTIRKLLCTNGFGYVWENQGTENVNRFLVLTQRPILTKVARAYMFEF